MAEASISLRLSLMSAGGLQKYDQDLNRVAEALTT
jgi:hypothetical protein